MSFFISEVSSNHSQNLDRCINFIDKSSEIGCDAVKFQLFKIDSLFTKDVLEKREDVKERKKWELPIEFLPDLSDRCKKKKIKFSCTPFYLDAVEELLPFVDFFKIASYEILWDDLIKECSITKKPLIISTGMANMNEIRHAIYISKKYGCEDISLMHCVSNYPASISDVNLKAIETMRKEFGCKIGWSDHSLNSSVLRRAIHKWEADFIEFHLDLDGQGQEYEPGHCWLPQEIEPIIKDARKSSLIDGNGVKEPRENESIERSWRADPSDGLRPLLATRKEN